jgi:hypothetical protein
MEGTCHGFLVFSSDQNGRTTCFYDATTHNLVGAILSDGAQIPTAGLTVLGCESCTPCLAVAGQAPTSCLYTASLAPFCPQDAGRD